MRPSSTTGAWSAASAGRSVLSSRCRGLYKLTGDASGPNRGPLTAEEKAEIDGLSVEQLREKYARQKAFAKGASSFRGVCVP